METSARTAFVFTALALVASLGASVSQTREDGQADPDRRIADA